MNHRIRLLCLSGILILTFLPVRAQRRSSSPGVTNDIGGITRGTSLRGTVRSAESSSGIGFVRVELRVFGGGQLGLALTNAEGEFSFNGLQAGDYELAVEKDGYEPLRQTCQVMGMTGPQFAVVYLKRLEGSVPTGGRAAISAQELALPLEVKKDYEEGIAALYEKHNSEASLPLFARVIAKAPDFSGAYYHTGVADRNLGRNQEAETALRKAIKLSGGRYGHSKILLASLLVDEKKFAEAEKMARQGLATAPRDWTGNYELARALMGQHREDEAEKSMQDAVAAHPDIPKAYLFLANIHLNRKDGASLIKDLDNFLRLDPKGPQSDKARKMKEQTQKELAEAKAAPTRSPHQE